MEKETDAERERKLKAVEKSLGEPFALEFSDALRKMRAHLLICVVISLAATLMDLKIKPDTPVFGVTFDGLTNQKIFLGLFTINAYLLLHFFWSSLDSFQEWRLRRTGTMVAYVTTASKSFYGGGESLDFSAEPKHSTLYSWWHQNTNRLIAVPEIVNQIDSNIKAMMDAVIVELNKAQTPELVNWQTNFMATRQQLSEVTESLKNTIKVLNDERIPISLQRFDTAFRVLLTSQNARWLLFEWLLPLVLGLAAAIRLYVEIRLPV